MAVSRPKPNIDLDNKPFWDAVKERKFMLMKCKECGEWYWPAAYCRKHSNQPFYQSLEWKEASGLGTVFVHNIHYKALHPAFADEIPYVFALIELDEGPMFGTNIVGCKPEDVRIGMRVKVDFAEKEDDVILPVFRPL